MKTYSVKIMNLADFFKFTHYVRKNHIKGELVQKNYRVNARNVPGIIFALPLNSAELIIRESDAPVVDSFIAEIQHA